MRDRLRRILLPRLGRDAGGEMDDEIGAHIQLHADELTRAGMDPDRSRREAEQRFERLRHSSDQLRRGAQRRDARLRRRGQWSGMRTDVRFALRQMRRAPAQSLLTVTTLALGIALTGTMFTLTERVVLRALPYPHAERLFMLDGQDSARRTIHEVSVDDWADWKRSPVIASTGLVTFSRRASVVVADTAVRATVVNATDGFLRALGAPLRSGRLFTAAETHSGAGVAVVSDAFWRRLIGGSGRLPARIIVDYKPYDVIGVISDDAVYPAGTDMWLPIDPALQGGGAARDNINYAALIRLRAGISLAAATADLDRVSRGIRAHDPAGLYDHGVVLAPLREVIDNDFSNYFRLLMAAVGCILLIACANHALITIGRAGARRHEMATRAALGASRVRLTQQLLVEQALIGVVAGAFGIALAVVALHQVVTHWGDQIPRAGEIHLDGIAAGFFVLVSLAVGLIAGLVPAIRGSHVSLHAGMKGRGRGGSRHGNAAASALVAVEVALAVLLLVGAGLLVHSFTRLLGRRLGFDRDVATVELNLGVATDSTQRIARWDRLMDRYRAIPGVEHVAVANWVPLHSAGSGFVDIKGRPLNSAGALYRVASEDYLATMGIRLLKSRNFSRDDGPDTPRVGLISEAMATKYWPGQSPLGQRILAISMDPGDFRPITVVGVVSDVRQYGLETDVVPEMYVPLHQAPEYWTRDMTIVVSGRLPPPRLVQSLRVATAAVAPTLAGDFSTLDLQLRSALAPRRAIMSLISLFAALALGLGGLGSFGILSYAVAQRARELSVRAALGAQRLDLLSLVIRSGVGAIALGLGAGLVASLLVSRLLGSMLVGVRPLDPPVYIAAVLTIVAGAGGALAVPALRAMRMDPLNALRSE
jgi:predicted permease